MADFSSLNFGNNVFSSFAFYSAIVLMKTVCMSVWTSINRIAKKVFSNPEDYSGMGVAKPETLTPDPHIERIRRCHQNDLENIVPFVLIGLLYVTTGPQLGTALIHFRVFTCARLLHTIVYLKGFGQPYRGLCFFLGFLVNVSMAIAVIRETA